MAQDRFVYWTAHRPTFDELKTVLEDYTRGLGTVEANELPPNDKTLLVKFPGKPTDTFERLLNRESPYHDERWVEVYVDEDHIDVITRSQDPIVNAIAEGFARSVGLYWKGLREQQ